MQSSEFTLILTYQLRDGRVLEVGFKTYDDYIRSRWWRDRHARWLKRARYRCMFWLFLKLVGCTVNGKWQRYHIHHTHYTNIGHERFWWDILILSEEAHRFIHEVLGGTSRVRDQRSPYPNLLQRIAHNWCRINFFVKEFIG